MKTSYLNLTLALILVSLKSLVAFANTNSDRSCNAFLAQETADVLDVSLRKAKNDPTIQKRLAGAMILVTASPKSGITVDELKSLLKSELNIDSINRNVSNSILLLLDDTKLNRLFAALDSGSSPVTNSVEAFKLATAYVIGPEYQSRKEDWSTYRAASTFTTKEIKLGPTESINKKVTMSQNLTLPTEELVELASLGDIALNAVVAKLIDEGNRNLIIEAERINVSPDHIADLVDADTNEVTMKISGVLFDVTFYTKDHLKNIRVEIIKNPINLSIQEVFR